MSSYKPPYTITSKILKSVSEISELLSDIKHIDKSYSTLTLRKKNRIRSITGTLQIEGNSFDEAKVTNVINGKTVLGTVREIEEVSSKSNQKSNQKIISLIKKNNLITIKELCEKTKLSESGVKKVIKKLKDENLLIRVGGLKGGHWEVVE